MIDDYPPYEAVTKCEPIPVAELDEKRPGLALFRRQVLDLYGGTGAGAARWRDCAELSSRHHETRAWDWAPPDDETADGMIAELLASDDEGNAHALARRFGIRSVIWQRRIWTAPAADFVPYYGDNPHTDHVHYGFSWAGAMGETSGYQEGPKGESPWIFPGGGSAGASDVGRESGTVGDEMALYHWTTTADGCVLVDRGTGLGLELLTVVSPSYRQQLDTIAEKWGAIAADAGAARGAPVSWILGAIFRESGGAHPTPVGTSGEVGLMQIIPRMHGMSAAELVDPAANIDKGAQLLGDSLALGYDLPQALSRYNAGAGSSGQPHGSTVSPWGMAETPGHIESIVRAHNYYLGQLCRAGVPAQSRLGPLLAFGALLGWLVARDEQ